jgi:hypothetical protein
MCVDILNELFGVVFVLEQGKIWHEKLEENNLVIILLKREKEREKWRERER